MIHSPVLIYDEFQIVVDMNRNIKRMFWVLEKQDEYNIEISGRTCPQENIRNI